MKQEAKRLGFDLCGIAPAGPIEHETYFRTWLEAGRAGSMEYLQLNCNKCVNPRELLEGARSVVVVGLLYHRNATRVPASVSSGRGRVAMYAWGEDYHRVMKDKLFALTDRFRERRPGGFRAKICVDTAPLVEREAAAKAGIGWIGKNTLVLHPQLGSYFFLGAIVTNLALTPDEPMPDHCGTCTACLDACPTGAFPRPYEMDASRCISYLTIEHRGDIDESLQPGMGDWVFGCDICQEVCPHNRRAPETTEPRFAVRSPGPTPRLSEILLWSDADYRQKLKGSAMKRAKLEMLKRNARIAQANQASRETLRDTSNERQRGIGPRSGNGPIPDRGMRIG